MHYPHSSVKSLVDFIREIHTASPWKDQGRFFKTLHRIVPFDNSAAFVKVDPQTSRILASPMTLWQDEANVLKDHNEYYWRFKQPIVTQIIKNRFRSFHVQNALPQFLSKPQSEEYRIDFWEKHRKRFSYALYFKTRKGWYSLYLTRSARSPDFSEEEQGLLNMLVPHMELTLTAAEPETPTLFADPNGNIVCLDRSVNETLKKNPALAKRFQGALSTWIGWFLADPFKPLRTELREEGLAYRCSVSPAGTAKYPLFRITWEPLEGTAHFSESILSHFCRGYTFSPREKEVILLIAAGKQRKEMAQALGLSIETVKEYLSGVYRKTGVEGKGELLAKLLSKMKAPPGVVPE